jgi:hypothetical protein
MNKRKTTRRLQSNTSGELVSCNLLVDLYPTLEERNIVFETNIGSKQTKIVRLHKKIGLLSNAGNRKNAEPQKEAKKKAFLAVQKPHLLVVYGKWFRFCFCVEIAIIVSKNCKINNEIVFYLFEIFIRYL